MNVAERRFKWLLEQRGYQYWTESELEQKIKVIKTRPDFFVETSHGNMLIEVEAFKDPGPLELRQNKFGCVDPEEFFKRIKKPVKHAARQLKPYKHLNIPCLVVLDNWRRLSIPTGLIELIQIFGTLEFRGEVDCDNGVIGPIQLYHGKNRRLAENQHTYVSAVAVNIAKVRFDDLDYVDDMTRERPMKLRIIHNPFTECPMPLDIFNDIDDEQYVYCENKWTLINSN